MENCSKKQVRYIVLHHTMPILEVNPLSSDATLTILAADIAHARQQVKTGKVYSQAKVRKLLGL